MGQRQGFETILYDYHRRRSWVKSATFAVNGDYASVSEQRIECIDWCGFRHSDQASGGTPRLPAYLFSEIDDSIEVVISPRTFAPTPTARAGRGAARGHHGFGRYASRTLQRGWWPVARTNARNIKNRERAMSMLAHQSCMNSRMEKSARPRRN